MTEQPRPRPAIALYRGDGEKIVLDIGQDSLRYLHFTPNQAIDLGNALLKEARKARKHNVRNS